MTLQLLGQALSTTNEIVRTSGRMVKDMLVDLRHPTIESNNRLAIFLLGFLPGAFGSLTAVCMAAWSVWAIVSIAAKTYPARLSPVSFRVALALTALPAALAVGMIPGEKDMELLRKAPEAAVFLSGWLLLFRFESRPRTGQFTLLSFGGALGCIAALLIALVQFAVGQRAEGGAGNANVFCLVVSVQTLFALFGLLDLRKEIQQLSIAGAISGALCVVLSGSRLGWIFFVVAVAAAVHSLSRHQRFSLLAFSRGAGALLLFMFAAALTNWHRLVAAVQDIRMIAILGDYNSSIGERVVYWISGYRAFLDSPFVGYGINNRMSAITRNAPEGYEGFITATHPHNDYLAAVVDSGIIGLTGLLIALCGPYLLMRSGRHAKHPATSLTGCVTLTYALFGLNGNMFGHDISSAVFLLAVTHLTAIYSFEPER